MGTTLHAHVGRDDKTLPHCIHLSCEGGGGKVVRLPTGIKAELCLKCAEQHKNPSISLAP